MKRMVGEVVSELLGACICWGFVKLGGGILQGRLLELWLETVDEVW
jgi:hypothetical protein